MVKYNIYFNKYKKPEWNFISINKYCYTTRDTNYMRYSYNYVRLSIFNTVIDIGYRKAFITDHKIFQHDGLDSLSKITRMHD